jgi:hypothetical protein
MVGQRVTFQIEHNQCLACKPAQFRDQFDYLSAWKMMQNRGAKHKIERVW